MNVHKNARLTPLGRERIVRMASAGTASAVIARAAGVSLKTVHKWIARFAAEGMAGLADRSSRPHRLHRPTPETRVAQIIVLRRQRLSGKAIAKQVGVSPATVSRVLRRARLSRMRDLDPAEPIRRYERALPGELIHIDIKSSTVSVSRGIASPGIAAPAEASGRAGSSPMSASTMPRGWPSSR
jgi:transposase